MSEIKILMIVLNSWIFFGIISLKRTSFVNEGELLFSVGGASFLLERAVELIHGEGRYHQFSPNYGETLALALCSNMLKMKTTKQTLVMV